MISNTSKVPELGKVAQGAIFNFVGAISRTFLGFLLVYVLAKVLNANDMGVFFLGVNIVTVLAIVSLAGVDMSLRRFIPIVNSQGDHSKAWTYFYTGLVIVIPTTLIIALTLVALSGYLGSEVFNKPHLQLVLQLLSIFLVLFSIAQFLLAATQSFKKMQYWVISLDIVNNALRIVIILILAYFGFKLMAGLWAYIVSIVVATALAIYFFIKTMPKREGEVGKLEIRDVLCFSIPVAISRLVNSGNGSVEILLLGYFLQATQVGLYTVAVKIVSVGVIVLASFNTMFSPMISEYTSKNHIKELGVLFSSITRWVFIISLPLYSLIAWFAPSIGALFGKEYVHAQTCIVVLCLGQIVNSLTGPAGQILLMSGQSFVNLWTNLTGFIITIVLNVALIPQYGIVGSALGVSIAVAVVNIIRLFLTWRMFNIHPYEVDYLKPVVAIGLGFVVLCFIGVDWSQVINMPEMILYSLIVFIIYISMIAVLGINKNDQYILGRLKSRLVRKSF